MGNSVIGEAGSSDNRSAEGRPSPFRNRTGQILAGRYTLTRKIGEGGMGEVYEAKHLGLDRPVAIKLLHDEFLQRECYRERFSREARTLASFRSEHIVAVTDYGETDSGLPFMVMEYLVGEDLRKLLKRHSLLPVARAVKLVADACKGVSAAHANGLVHRDIKPENLFVSSSPSGRESCKVLDFGVAKQSNASTLTRDGALIGTARYMAPEQALGEKDIDGRVDVFALGSILYECLCGEPAFDGDRPEAILFAIIHRTPAALSDLNPEVPKSLERIVARALARSPADRYQSIDEFAAALEVFQARARSASVNPRPDSHAARALMSDQATLPETGEGSTIDQAAPIPSALPSERKLRSRLVFTCGLIAGALLGAGATVSTISSNAGEPSGSSTRAAPEGLESHLPATLAESAMRTAALPAHPATPEPSNPSSLAVSDSVQSPDDRKRSVEATRPSPPLRSKPAVRPSPPLRSAKNDLAAQDEAEPPSAEASLDLVPNPYRR